DELYRPAFIPQSRLVQHDAIVSSATTSFQPLVTVRRSPPLHMSFGPRKPLKHILIALAVCVALGALLAGAFGFVVTRVPAYRVQVQDWLNEQTGLAVEFQSLSAGLRLYGPELRFDQAVLRTPDRTRILATATRGSVGFDLWRALREGRLMAGRFRLQSPQIGLIRT